MNTSEGIILTQDICNYLRRAKFTIIVLTFYGFVMAISGCSNSTPQTNNSSIPTTLSPSPIPATQTKAVESASAQKDISFVPKMPSKPQSVNEFLLSRSGQTFHTIFSNNGTIIIGRTPEDDKIMDKINNEEKVGKKLEDFDLTIPANRENVVRNIVEAVGVEKAVQHKINMWDKKGKQYHWPSQ